MKIRARLLNASWFLWALKKYPCVVILQGYILLEKLGSNVERDFLKRRQLNRTLKKKNKIIFNNDEKYCISGVDRRFPSSRKKMENEPRLKIGTPKIVLIYSQNGGTTRDECAYYTFTRFYTASLRKSRLNPIFIISLDDKMSFPDITSC